MTDWAKLKVVDLKAELKSRGLPANGLKVDLVARLEAADQDQPAIDEVEQDSKVEEATEQVEAQEEPAPVEEPEKEPSETAANNDTAMKDEPIEPAPKEEIPKEHAPVLTAENDALEAPAELVAADVDQKQSPSEEQVKPDREADPATQNTTQEVTPAIAEVDADDSKPESGQPIEKMAVDETRDEPTQIPSPAPEQSSADSPKRKRRTQSPPPTEEDIARKRARAEEPSEANGDGFAPAARVVDEAAEPAPADDRPQDQDAMEIDHAPSASDPYKNPSTYEPEFVRDVVPSMHPATPALYITNLMRPLRPTDVQSHLVDLATAPGEATSDDTIVNFYLDQIRTHAFVVFNSTAAASRVRNALHDRIWPDERNRKALWVDFIPLDKVAEWVDIEENSGRSRGGSRYEVIYQDGPDGNIEARLESGAVSTSRPGPPPPRAAPAPAPPAMAGSANSIPIGPRGFRDARPPTGPRAVRPGTGPGPRPPPGSFDTRGGSLEAGVVERTRAHPTVAYKMAPDDVARRRIDNMRSYYTADSKRSFGREINRYSFERGDSFVDRGKEIFEGIRPPHRERAMARGRRGEGPPPRAPYRGGRGGFRPRSDRYLPGGGGGGGGDRRGPRYMDDRSRSPPRRGYRDRR